MFRIILNKKARRKIRNQIRGYEYIKANKNIQYLNEIKYKLSLVPISKKKLSKIYDDPTEITLHQFLFIRLLNTNFNSSILEFFGNNKTKFSYPLPSIWINILENHDIRVAKLASRFKWIFFQLKWYLIGLYTFLNEIKDYLFFSTNNLGKPYFFCEGIKESCIPSFENKNNLIGWLTKQNELKNISQINHSLKINQLNFEEKKILKEKKFRILNSKLIFTILKILNECIFSFFSIKGRLLLREKIFEILADNSNDLASYYFFTNTNLRFRPLWTYKAEEKGSRICLLLYSSNIFPFKLKINSKIFPDYKWNLFNWKEYWVWNKEQQINLKRFLNTKSEVVVKGFIPYNSKKILNLKVSSNKKILVFGVDPQRISRIVKLGLEHEYYTTEKAKMFYNYIYEITEKNGFELFFKIKRNSLYHSKSYTKFLSEFSKRKNVFCVDSEFSAFDLVKFIDPHCVISMPYTSTAHMAKILNYQSLYFDSSNELDKNHSSNMGIQVIQDKNELDIFLNNHIQYINK